jgi:hypothetical protein
MPVPAPSESLRAITSLHFVEGSDRILVGDAGGRVLLWSTGTHTLLDVCDTTLLAQRSLLRSSGGLKGKEVAVDDVEFTDEEQLAEEEHTEESEQHQENHRAQVKAQVHACAASVTALGYDGSRRVVSVGTAGGALYRLTMHSLDRLSARGEVSAREGGRLEWCLLSGHQAPVLDLAVAKHADLLLSTALDRSVFVWHAELPQRVVAYQFDAFSLSYDPLRDVCFCGLSDGDVGVLKVVRRPMGTTPQAEVCADMDLIFFSWMLCVVVWCMLSRMWCVSVCVCVCVCVCVWVCMWSSDVLCVA